MIPATGNLHLGLDLLSVPELEGLVVELDALQAKLWREAKALHARIDATTARLQAAEKSLRRRRQCPAQGVLEVGV